MESGSQPPSAWLAGLADQVFRGRHVILHGNVGDYALVTDGRHALLPDAVGELLTSMGYQGMGRYDIVDGLRSSITAGPNAFDQVFTTVIGSAEDATPDQGESERKGASASAEATTVRSRLREIARAPHAAASTNPEVAASMLGRLLAQTGTPIAVWVEAADLLLRDPRHVELAERQLLMRIRNAMRAAAMVEGARGHRLRNLLLFSTARLSDLPDWFYRDEASVAPFLIEPPGVSERRAFLNQLAPSFRGASGLSDEEGATAVETLAHVTERMRLKDLEEMQRTSQLVRIGIDEPRRLANYFRFGARRDPWSELGSAEVRSSRERLADAVVGQSQAINAVAEALTAAQLGIDFVADPMSRTSRPRAAFFFVGPTGVGKTELAKALATLIFKDQNALIRFDMSEYGQEHSDERLVGSPPGYVGYGEGGQLTSRVLERPFSVLLFDEIEKAHRKVFDKFLQILDEGRLTDGRGQTADFSQTIIIFTSNQGTAQLYAAGDTSALSYHQVREHYRRHLVQFFRDDLGRPELLGRLGEDNILAFDILRPETVAAIARKFLTQLLASMSGSGVGLELDETEILSLIEREVDSSGALAEGGRGIRRSVDRLVRRPLLRWLLENEVGEHELRLVPDDVSGETRVEATLPSAPDAGEVSSADECQRAPQDLLEP